jgi:hypothetical protein
MRRPELVKKRETSFPASALRAMDSAEMGFFLRDVFFIKFSLFRGGFPESHQMMELAFGIFPDLKNHGIEAIAYPADGTILMGEIHALVQVVRMKEDLLRLLKTDTPLGIPPKAFALPRIEVESHLGITVIP